MDLQAGCLATECEFSETPHGLLAWKGNAVGGTHGAREMAQGLGRPRNWESWGRQGVPGCRMPAVWIATGEDKQKAQSTEKKLCDEDHG